METMGKYHLRARPLASPPPIYCSNYAKSPDLREARQVREDREANLRERKGRMQNEWCVISGVWRNFVLLG
jgi:hypothetical protein